MNARKADSHRARCSTWVKAGLLQGATGSGRHFDQRHNSKNPQKEGKDTRIKVVKLIPKTMARSSAYPWPAEYGSGLHYVISFKSFNDPQGSKTQAVRPNVTQLIIGLQSLCSSNHKHLPSTDLRLGTQAFIKCLLYFAK